MRRLPLQKQNLWLGGKLRVVRQLARSGKLRGEASFDLQIAVGDNESPAILVLAYSILARIPTRRAASPTLPASTLLTSARCLAASAFVSGPCSKSTAGAARQTISARIPTQSAERAQKPAQTLLFPAHPLTVPALVAPYPPLHPLYTPCNPPVVPLIIPLYFNRVGLQGVYRGCRGGLLGDIPRSLAGARTGVHGATRLNLPSQK
jgi:hypothetical protein